ncbi:MAG: hypothetical protein QNK03_14885 [Myxococcota bacterium]|nr:hypothetical protein [Myxococcota bacterium]
MRTERESIVRRRIALAAAGGALLGALGCARPGPGDPAALAQDLAKRPADGALRAELIFGAAGDFDLYVSGPLQETVYFANTPARSGGRLLADRGCRDATPRIETVVFESPQPGPYRVGVDFHTPCEGHEGPAPFAVRVVHPGGQAEAQGSLEPEHFEPIVLELELAPAP